MARTGSKTLPLCLLAVLFGCALRQTLLPGQAEVGFVQLPRGDAAAALVAATIVAAAAAAPIPAFAADETKFSFFGFGDGSSDAYSQNFDASTPYSQFSDEKDGDYNKKGQESYVQKKKAQLAESFKRFEKIPALIKQKQSESVKSILTLQLSTMGPNMEYVTAKGSPAFVKAREFLQDVADIGVANGAKRWPEAQAAYDSAVVALGEWKALTGF